MIPLLQSERIALRAPEAADLDALHEIENDTAAWPYGDQLYPITRDALRRFLEHYTSDPLSTSQLRFMAEDKQTGRCVAVADMYDIDLINRRCAVAIYVMPDKRGQRVGTECLGILERYCRRHLGLLRLYAYVNPDNEPSMRLFARCGYQDIATLPGWIVRGNTPSDLHLLHLAL